MSERAAENLITWNVPNWVTVILMVTIGFFLVGLGGNLARSLTGQGSDETASA